MTSLGMYRGDDRSLVITASEPLTGSDLTFTARARRDGEASITKTSGGGGISIGENDDADQATITLLAADTANLEEGPLFWDVQIVDGAGLTHTVAAGILLVKSDVSHG